MSCLRLPQLDYYLPLPPLLDPYLGEIIGPLMTTLSFLFHALWHRRREPGAVYSNTKRIARVGRLVNWVIKVRGRKHVGKLGALARPLPEEALRRANTPSQ